MRASTASMILAFCAMLAVQSAPVNGGNALVSRDFEYDAETSLLIGLPNREMRLRSVPNTAAALAALLPAGHEKRADFEYDAKGNEIDARSPKKKAKKAKRDSFEYDAEGNELDAKRSTDDFEYNPDGSEIEKRATDDFEYDSDGNELDARSPKKKAKKAKRDGEFE